MACFRVLVRVRFQFSDLLRHMAMQLPKTWIKLAVLAVLVIVALRLVQWSGERTESYLPRTVVLDSDNIEHTYDSSNHPFIFIGTTEHIYYTAPYWS